MIEQNVSSISQMIFDKISSPYKQHATMLSVGETGDAKSYSMLKVCEELSFKLAKWHGGDPEDYFNIDHVAIITKDEIKRVMGIFKKYGVYIMDDFGVGDNARESAKKDNKKLNDVLETFRPNNNFLGMTVPRKFMIDKIPRNIVHLYMEMDTPKFEFGYGIGKLFFIDRNLKADTVNYFFPSNGAIYKRYIFELPSKKLIDAYDKKREQITKELEEQNTLDFNDNRVVPKGYKHNLK